MQIQFYESWTCTFSTSHMMLSLLLCLPSSDITWVCTWKLCSSFLFCSQTTCWYFKFSWADRL